MGESGRGFGLAVMRKSKLNENSKNKKTKIINMIISHFLYIIIIIIIVIIIVIIIPIFLPLT